MNKERRKAQSATQVDLDEILPEYNFSRARPNKYASRYASASAAPARNHYYVERRKDGRYSITRKGSDRAAKIVDTQAEAIERVKELNPDDRPDVERVRDTREGGRDKWRSSRG